MLVERAFTGIGDLPVSDDDFVRALFAQAFTAPSPSFKQRMVPASTIRRCLLTASRRAVRLQVMSGRGQLQKWSAHNVCSLMRA